MAFSPRTIHVSVSNNEIFTVAFADKWWHEDLGLLSAAQIIDCSSTSQPVHGGGENIRFIDNNIEYNIMRYNAQIGQPMWQLGSMGPSCDELSIR